MLDPNKLRNDLARSKQFKDLSGAGKGGRGMFNFMRCSDLNDGRYRMRFLPPNASRCPEGYKVYTTQGVEMISGGQVQVILHPESYDPPSTEEGYLDSCLRCILETIPLESMSPDLQNAIRKLLPWRRYLFPVYFFADSVTTQSQGKDGKTYENRIYTSNPGGNPVGLIWEIQAEGLIERIAEIIHGNADRGVKPHPYLTHHRLGNHLWFTKNGTKYTIDVEEEPTEIDSRAANFLSDEHYPHLNKVGQKFKKSRSEQEAFVKTSWWGQLLAHYRAPGIEGIDLSDDFET